MNLGIPVRVFFQSGRLAVFMVAFPSFFLSGMERVHSSQVHLQSLSEMAGAIHTAVRVHVLEESESEDRKTIYGVRPGPPTAFHTDMECRVDSILAGRCDLKKITVRYTKIVPVSYNGRGKEIMRYSPILPESGIEDSIEAGKEYIFCFSQPLIVPPADGRFSLLRAEPIEREQELGTLLAEAEAWRVFCREGATSTSTVAAFRLDPETGEILFFHGRGWKNQDGLTDELAPSFIPGVSPEFTGKVLSKVKAGGEAALSLSVGEEASPLIIRCSTAEAR